MPERGEEVGIEHGAPAATLPTWRARAGSDARHCSADPLQCVQVPADGRADLSAILQVIAHPLRLALLVALGEREQSADELALALSQPLAAVTEQLAVLRTANFVTDGTAPAHLRATTTTGWAEIAAQLEQLQDGDVG